ncbi:Proteasome core particle subunit beta 7 [Paragonimus kellicotti]|nr:Proteasome core particle subunit beta 7 [Paragonimus kellicotti]
MDDCLATGFGSYLAIPLLRQRLEDIAGGDPNKLSENDAVQAITDAMRQLYFRDCRAFNTYQLAFVRSDGVEIRGPLQLESDWSIAEYVAGYE